MMMQTKKVLWFLSGMFAAVTIPMIFAGASLNMNARTYPSVPDANYSHPHAFKGIGVRYLSDQQEWINHWTAVVGAPCGFLAALFGGLSTRIGNREKWERQRQMMLEAIRAERE